MGAAIEVVDLAKAYGELRAVDGVTFDVGEGEFFGILGPNGAGKTTTLEMIEGLRQPDAGDDQRARSCDRGRATPSCCRGSASSSRHRRSSNGSPRASRSTPWPPCTASGRAPPTSGWSASGWTTRPTPGSETCPAVRRSGCRSPARSCTTRRWSSSTSRPPALDPQARRNLWELLAGLNDSGRTVVLTTHYMDEAEVLCDRVAIIDHGRILQLDSPGNLIRALDAPTRITVAPGQLTRVGGPGDGRGGRRRGGARRVVLRTMAPGRGAHGTGGPGAGSPASRCRPGPSRTSSSTSPAASTAHDAPTVVEPRSAPSAGRDRPPSGP